MATLLPEFKKNLESAIIEHGRFACPSMECTEWITSKKTTKKNGAQVIKYNCTNSDCTFHIPKTIILHKKKTALAVEPKTSNNPLKILMVGVASILLLLIIAFGRKDTSSNISKKEKTPVVKEKRKIVLSTPVFKKE